MTSWAQYVTALVAESGTQAALADKVDADQTTIGRWAAGKQQAPTAQKVVHLARALGRPPLEALVAAGYLTAAEANERPTAAPSLDAVDDAELIKQLEKRLARGGDPRGKRAPTKDDFGLASRDVDLEDRTR